MESILSLREWLITFLFCGLLTVLALATWKNRHCSQNKSSFLVLESEQIELQLKGAVVLPGSYWFKPGVTLREVIAQVQLKPSAQRRGLDLKKSFYVSGEIEIPEKIKQQKVEKKKRGE